MCYIQCDLLKNCSAVTSPVVVSWAKTLKNPGRQNILKKKARNNVISSFVIHSDETKYFPWTFDFSENVISHFIHKLTHPGWSQPYRAAGAGSLPLDWTGRWGGRMRHCSCSSLNPEAGRDRKVESRPTAFYNICSGEATKLVHPPTHTHTHKSQCKTWRWRLKDFLGYYSSTMSQHFYRPADRTLTRQINLDQWNNFVAFATLRQQSNNPAHLYLNEHVLYILSRIYTRMWNVRSPSNHTNVV